MSAPIEAAMDAAREIHPQCEDHWLESALKTFHASLYVEEWKLMNQQANKERERLAAIILTHFQPLLAKVEGERDELKITLWNREQDILGLRREQAEAFSIRDAALNKYSAVVDLLGESLGWQDREATLRAELAAAKALFERHTKAVGEFLNELYAISCDPLAEGTMEVSEMKAALLEAAKRDHGLRADLAEKETALEELAQASHVFQLGAQTGQQWLLLTRAILCARSALASRADKGGAT